MVMRLSAPAFLVNRPQLSRVRRDFDCLLERMHQRLYPETMQVLNYYWLKTICVKRYRQSEWKALDHLLQQAWADRRLPTQAVQSIHDLREWIQQIHHKNGQSSPRSRPSVEPTRQVSSEALVPYLFRFLNEWLPVEVARLLVAEPEEGSDESGIPTAVVATAIERLLLREHLSRATLESMLVPGLFTPRFIYPADWEILQDVVLYMLGRTAAPPPAKLPAVLLCAAPDAALSQAYGEAVSAAILTAGFSGAEELHVPIPPAQARELMKTDHVRFTSAVVTMDGRLWQADQLQHGEQDCIVYRPVGRLRIDYSEDHARMLLPWPEARRRWSGPVSLINRVEMFGREWRISHWEQDIGQTLLHLEFVTSLPMTAIEPRGNDRLRRCRPAVIDMAWAALEGALEASVVRRNLEPVERLRRDELVPLGRALFGLAESLMTRRLRTIEAIDKRLNGIRYLSAQLSSVYGPVPWRILPKRARKILLANCRHRPSAYLLRDVFEGLPEEWYDPVPAERWFHGSLKRLWHRRSFGLGSSSPSQAA
jgi:hypothetical protein